MSDKVFVVTGGSRGIGKAIVLAAVAQGARVAFCARHVEDCAQQVLDEAEHLVGSGQVIAVRADISQEQDVEALFDRTISAFGRVDVVVNNAGIYSPRGDLSGHGLLLQVPTTDWDLMIAINLTGAFLVTRRAIREFLSQGSGGVVISIGSISQDGGSGLVSYGVSKAGQLGLSRAIACQYGSKGVRSHVIVTGFLNTDLNKDAPEEFRRALVEWGPQKRSGLVEEIASIVLFLASPRCALFNAIPIYASGGAKDLPATLPQVR
jgi:3-oxoacyl-[acyl-carrier protein] reductase